MVRSTKETRVRRTGRQEWRWHSATDKITLYKRSWRRKIVRVQYLFVEFSCGHWQRLDFVPENKTGYYRCAQCEQGQALLDGYDRQEVAA